MKDIKLQHRSQKIQSPLSSMRAMSLSLSLSLSLCICWSMIKDSSEE